MFDQFPIYPNGLGFSVITYSLHTFQKFQICSTPFLHQLQRGGRFSEPPVLLQGIHRNSLVTLVTSESQPSTFHNSPVHKTSSFGQQFANRLLCKVALASNDFVHLGQCPTIATQKSKIQMIPFNSGFVCRFEKGVRVSSRLLPFLGVRRCPACHTKTPPDLISIS